MIAKPTPSPSRKREGGRKKQPDLVRRQQAVAATMAKYRARAFDWKGKATCLHLARFHLLRMGRKPPPLPQVGSLLAARRALAERGWADVGDMLDAIGLERISPAAMRLGDLAVVDSEDKIGSIFVAASPTKFIGWREDCEGLAVIDVTGCEISMAWRV